MTARTTPGALPKRLALVTENKVRPVLKDERGYSVMLEETWSPPGFGAEIARRWNAHEELRDALRDLAKIARTISDRAHAGIKVPGDEWSGLYAELNAARALLARLDGDA